MKYAWIDKHRQTYSTTLMCELLSVSRSGLNAARSRAPSKRALEEERLVKEIGQSQRKHRGRYGRRRMTTEVSEASGRPVNHKRVARVMREHGLQSHKRRRFRVVTTDSKHAHPVAPNVLERDFEATAPDQKWLADITCVPTDEGWLYVALVLDLYARKLVGWALSEGVAAGADVERAGRLPWGGATPTPACYITRTEDRSTRQEAIARSSKRAASRCR